MKTLYIIRHATSDWQDGNAFDFERKLTLKGYSDIESLSYNILAHHIQPEVILTSCAIRAQETSLTLSKQLNYSGKIHYMEEFYLGTAERLKETLTLQPDEYSNLCIIGHNSQLCKLIELLTKENIEKMLTSSMIAVTLNIDSWIDLENSIGKIDFCLYAHEEEITMAS